MMRSQTQSLHPAPVDEEKASSQEEGVEVTYIVERSRRLSKVHLRNVIGEAIGKTHLDKDDIAECMRRGVAKLFLLRDPRPGDRKVDFDTHGGKTCRVEEYEAAKFDTVRKIFGEDQKYEKYLLGLDANSSEQEKMSVVAAKDAAGKSPAWFLVTQNQEYIVKTCKPSEANLLMNLLDAYIKYIESHESTLLPQFYGLYKVERSKKTTILLVMRNVFAACHPIRHRYDLKGSTYKRSALNKGEKDILQDLDFLDRGKPLIMDSGRRNERNDLCAMIEQDSKWLSDQGLLDYSLLVGLAKEEMPLHSIQGGRSELAQVQALRGSALVLRGDERLAYVGIIDILTSYDCKKKIEFRWKTALRGDVSCKPPPDYASRFSEFAKYIFVENTTSEITPTSELDKKAYKQAWMAKKPSPLCSRRNLPCCYCVLGGLRKMIWSRFVDKNR